jgi:hypothetical protein
MKKEYEVVKTVKYCDTYCDRCEEKIAIAHNDAFRFDWNFATGTNYGNDADGQEYKLDLCQACALKAVTLLREHGFNVRGQSWML